MKNDILSIFTIATLCLCTSNLNAQLKVKNDGSVKIGSQITYPSGGKLEITGANETLEARIFPTTANIARLWTINSVFGYGFGVDESGYGHIYRNINSPSSIMTFRSDGYVGIGRTPYYKLDVNGNIRVVTTIYYSDRRLKENISSLSDQADKLFNLNGVSYSMKNSLLEDNEIVQTETISQDKVLSQPVKHDERIHYGFIAQEVSEIYPDLVYEDKDGMLGIDYVGFIPILIEKMKKQNIEIENLKSEIKRIKTHQYSSPFEENTNGSLYQNYPNPFSEETKIKFELSNSVKSAELFIYDLNGKQIKSIVIPNNEVSEITIKATELQAGMYYYSLVADSKLIDTKKMILTDE